MDFVYVYIYIWYPPPKKNLCSPHFCWYLQYLVSTFGGLLDLSFWGTIYIYIFFFFCARRLHDLFVHFGRNAFRMHSMHSECILDQNQDPRSKIPTRLLAKILDKPGSKIQDPRFPQDSWLKSWINQDPRSKIPTRLLAKILDKPRSKIQDSHKTPG